MGMEALAHELACHGVRPSYQRIRVLQQLRQKDAHPTAEEIYQALLADMPTLARATVYNALHALVGAGLAYDLDAGDGETRYDAVMEAHGHFKCDRCGRLTDFAADLAGLGARGLEGYEIRARSVVFRGLCPKCVAMSPVKEQE